MCDPPTAPKENVALRARLAGVAVGVPPESARKHVAEDVIERRAPPPS
jgi:hypothetical protein